MPETKSARRPRVLVLVLALGVLAAVLAFTWWPAASPQLSPSNQSRESQRPTATATTGPGQLAVRLDELKQPSPEPSGENRNPFRFYVKPPPPPPPATKVTTPPPNAAPAVPIGPPPPPPIPLKFIGTMEQGRKRVAIFSDGRGLPVYASEGELVLGQYKVVRIGVESVVMEYPDGRGRQTIPMRGEGGR